MDQVKIGKFISEKRKEAGLTQAQLAEKLGITDRAVSKWETGRSLPDAAIMMDLCAVLKITVNDLLSGEEVSMENYNEKTAKVLIEMVRQKEEADKRLLAVEIVIGIVSTLVLFVSVLIAAYLQELKAPLWITAVLIAAGFLQFIIIMAFALRIEQTAGYYKCAKCGHTYVPTYTAVNMARHLGRTSWLKCPDCGKKSWQKKVSSKE